MVCQAWCAPMLGTWKDSLEPFPYFSLHRLQLRHRELYGRPISAACSPLSQCSVIVAVNQTIYFATSLQVPLFLVCQNLVIYCSQFCRFEGCSSHTTKSQMQLPFDESEWTVYCRWFGVIKICPGFSQLISFLISMYVSMSVNSEAIVVSAVEFGVHLQSLTILDLVIGEAT